MVTICHFGTLSDPQQGTSAFSSLLRKVILQSPGRVSNLIETTGSSFVADRGPRQGRAMVTIWLFGPLSDPQQGASAFSSLLRKVISQSPGRVSNLIETTGSSFGAHLWPQQGRSMVTICHFGPLSDSQQGTSAFSSLLRKVISQSPGRVSNLIESSLPALLFW